MPILLVLILTYLIPFFISVGISLILYLIMIKYFKISKIKSAIVCLIVPIVTILILLKYVPFSDI